MNVPATANKMLRAVFLQITLKEMVFWGVLFGSYTLVGFVFYKRHRRTVLALWVLLYLVFLFYITVLRRQVAVHSLRLIPLDFVFAWPIRQGEWFSFFLNFLLFYPYGCLTALFFRGKEKERLRLCTVAFFATTLCIEMLQLAFWRGTFDVNDLMSNTAGALAGYYCVAVLAPRFIRKHPA